MQNVLQFEKPGERRSPAPRKENSASARAYALFSRIVDVYADDMTSAEFADWLREPAQQATLRLINETRPDLVDRLRSKCEAVRQRLRRKQAATGQPNQGK